jgi:hypothetical protein
VYGHKPSYCLDAVIVLVSSFNSFRPLMEALSPLVKGHLGPVQGLSFRFISLSGCGPDRFVAAF